MLTQIANVLFPGHEENLWNSSTLFRGDIPDAAGSSASETLPILLGTMPTIRKDDREDLTLDLESPYPSPHGLSELSWATAAKDSAEGIHYVREKFPNENLTYLSQPFRREPITVDAGDKVAVLEELSEYAVRVRSLRDGAVGVVPSWNIEDALERLARLNMEFNEIVTSPGSESSRSSFATALSNSTFLSRRRSQDSAQEPEALDNAGGDACDSAPGSPEVTSDDDIDADLPATPTTPATVPRIRRVEFAQTPQKTIFRYPQPPVLGHEDASEGEEWWWDGWEESEGGARSEDGPSAMPPPGAAEEDADAEVDEDRLGRSWIRRTDSEAFVA